MRGYFGYKCTDARLDLPFDTSGFNIVKKEYCFSKNKTIDITPFVVSKYATNLIYDNLTLPDKITKDLSYFIGYFVANGNFRPNGIDFTSNNLLLLDNYRYLTNKIFKKDTSELRIKQDKVNKYELNSTVITAYLDKDIFNGRHTARFKTVPECVKGSSKGVVRNFLRGLFDCDSYIEHKSSFIFNTASEMVAKEVHEMLLGFGVIGSLRSFDNVKGYEGHMYWNISVNGKYLKQLMENVLYDSLVYSKDSFIWKRVNTNIDVIPALNTYLISELKSLRDLFGVKPNGRYYTQDGRCKVYLVNKFCPIDQRKNVTYELIDKTLISWDTLPEDQRKLVSKLYDLLYKIKNENVFFDKNIN